MSGILDYVKQHPVIVGIIVLGGGFVFYELALAPAASTDISGAANSQIASSGSGTTDLSAQDDSESFQLAALQQQQAGTYAVANLNAQTSTTQQVNAIAGQEDLSAINSQLQEYNISTQAAVAQDTLTTQQAIAQGVNDTSTALAKISSDTTLGYATIVNNAAVQQSQINANTQTTLGGFETAATLAQINAAQNIALGAQSVAKNASNNQAAGGIIGAIGGIIGGLF